MKETKKSANVQKMLKRADTCKMVRWTRERSTRYQVWDTTERSGDCSYVSDSGTHGRSEGRLTMTDWLIKWIQIGLFDMWNFLKTNIKSLKVSL